MKTGKLVKFRRPQAMLHAYLYRDGPLWRAAVYSMAPGERPDRDQGA